MDEAQATLAVLYRGWHDYQGLLITALVPLSPAELALRAAPHMRSIGEVVTHMIGARARWFHHDLGVGDQAFAALGTWDRRGMPARSAAELVTGLELTWQTMQEAIARWTPADWTRTYQNDPGDEPAVFTAQWVVWHLIEHDLHHGGEVSLMLGMHGLTAPDL
jgi:uncharacterized damage-inducible protein DinB